MVKVKMGEQTMSGMQVNRWLPRDERKLLAYYFKKLERPNDSETFRNPMELMKVLGCQAETVEEVQNSPFIWRVWDANDKLKKRDLANIERDETGMDVTVSLTLEGWDLGEKYNGWLVKSGLWFEEYRNHWIWLIVGFLGGILGALVIKWLEGNGTQ